MLSDPKFIIKMVHIHINHNYFNFTDPTFQQTQGIQPPTSYKTPLFYGLPKVQKHLQQFHHHEHFQPLFSGFVAFKTLPVNYLFLVLLQDSQADQLYIADGTFLLKNKIYNISK